MTYKNVLTFLDCKEITRRKKITIAPSNEKPFTLMIVKLTVKYVNTVFLEMISGNSATIQVLYAYIAIFSEGNSSLLHV